MTTGPELRASRRTQLLVVAMIAAAGGSLSAHRYDELLQAARIAVGPDRVRVEMTLTPGIEVAGAFLRTIDRDGNGVLSEEEQQAYARRVLSGVSLHIDEGAPLTLQLASADFPDEAAIRAGDGAIGIQSGAVFPSLPAGRHRLFFRNGHDPEGSVYLANALVPEDAAVEVTGQLRDGAQSELTIEFTLQRSPLLSARWAWMAIAGALLLVPSRRLFRVPRFTRRS